MTLLITVFVAIVCTIVCTIVWYVKAPQSKMRLGTLCLMYWGASVMWLVDAVYEYIELKDAFFTPAAEDMLNDAFLGLSVVALGLVIWLFIVLIKDPKGVVRAALAKKAE